MTTPTSRYTKAQGELTPLSEGPTHDAYDTEATIRAWLDVLTGVLGLDPAPYQDVSDALDTTARIQAWAAKWRTETTLDEPAAARLVGQADTFTDAAAAVATAVRATNDTERAAGARVFARAHSQATMTALGKFRGHAEHTFAQLQALYAASIAAHNAAADTLTAHGSPRTALEAHRAGAGDAWDSIETEREHRHLITAFIRHATGWGIIPHKGTQKHTDYGIRRLYSDPQKAAMMLEYQRLYTGWPAWKFDAHVYKTAGAQLRSTADADTSPEPTTQFTRNSDLDKKRRQNRLTAADIDRL